MTDLIRFEDVEFTIHDHDGGRWVTVKQLAQGLGYSDYKTLARLIRRNQAEFDGKTVGVKLTSTDGKQYEQTCLNYHGVIRAAMLSDAPRARRFRDWAEDVLFEVMTKGSYAVPGVEQAEQISTAHILREIADIRRENQEILKMVLSTTQAPTLGTPPLYPHPVNDLYDERRWLTFRRWVDKRFGSKRPKGFNKGGGAERACAVRHKTEFGSWPQERSPGMDLPRLSEFVYPVGAETDRFLRKFYLDWVRTHHPDQPALPYPVLVGKQQPRHMQ